VLTWKGPDRPAPTAPRRLKTARSAAMLAPMRAPPELDAAVRRYLPAPTRDCPVHLQDSEWVPVVDGIDYFAEVSGLLDRVGPGDAVLVAGLQVSPDLDLTGREEGEPGRRPLADLLAEKAHDGADVRVLLSGGVFSGGVPWLPGVGPFRANVEAARRMRGWVPSTRDTGRPPLRDRVLLDWSGALIGSNHQKIVLVRLGEEVTAFVGGLDLALDRFDAGPHDRMRLDGNRWGWHDAAVRLRGPAAERVWEVYRYRWGVAAALPRRYWMLSMGGLGVLNPPLRPLTVPAAPPQPERTSPGTAVTVVRSFNPWAIDSIRLLRRVRRPGLPANGVHEVFRTLATAIDRARRYVYVEDQYLKEMPGGGWRHTLYGPLRRAARRGVRVVLVGSGRRDPADGGRSDLSAVLTTDLRWRVVGRLPRDERRNVVMYRVRDLTVHAKVVLVDDVFACLGSANFFGRSMVGTDTELSSALVTTGHEVRDLRVRLWAEHLRTPLTDELRPVLEDLDTALGIWRRDWLPTAADRATWRRAGIPAGFAPSERVLVPVRFSRST
jgi:phosphatidylserine/phosphatidylglycerophosphate/cardiolipin synthase-like enzyme